MKSLISKFKPIYRGYLALYNLLYHFIRFWKYSGRQNKSLEAVEYSVMKTAHALEKSMGMKSQQLKSGWANAELLQELLSSKVFDNNFTYTYKIGAAILHKFVDFKSKNNSYSEKIKKIDFDESFLKSSGVFKFNHEFISFDKFLTPESFFMSRHSVRSFSGIKIERYIIDRIITIASKTPSACNRQEWFTYVIQDENLIKEALSLQSGNRGFGHEIKNLMIICADLNAFVPGQEAYQHWIDGGMYSMSIVYAIHSLGLVSCCLNWSTKPKTDKKLRSILKINDRHSVIMMLAFGKSNSNSFVCHSKRKPVESYYKIL